MRKIKRARKVMRDAFAADPGFRLSYQANIAMLLCDRYGITDHDKRNTAASDVIALVFGENEDMQKPSLVIVEDGTIDG